MTEISNRVIFYPNNVTENVHFSLLQELQSFYSCATFFSFLKHTQSILIKEKQLIAFLLKRCFAVIVSTPEVTVTRTLATLKHNIYLCIQRTFQARI